MSIIGIVGAEAAKFTVDGEAAARAYIRSLITPADTVVSGACHLGGIDIWAVQEARQIGAQVVEYPPATLQWSAGYKPRNLKIANASQIVHSIVVSAYPPNYKGMRFDICYHCGTKDHIKSGGCWTVKQARQMGKDGVVYVVQQ